jgi:hypothetical protein
MTMKTLIASLFVLAFAAQANAAPRQVEGKFDYFAAQVGQGS